jgi:hypothetical protein
MFENVSFCQPLGAAFDSPGERGLGALSRLPRNRPNCLTIRRNGADYEYCSDGTDVNGRNWSGEQLIGICRLCPPTRILTA